MKQIFLLHSPQHSRTRKPNQKLLFLNIDRKPEDHFFILFGSGHSKILQDLIEDSAGFELVQLKDLK